MMAATGVFHRVTADISPARMIISVTWIITIFLTTVLVYAFSLSQDYSTAEDECTLKYGPVVGISMMLRHGERNIETQLPKDPYRDYKYWPEGMGELRKNGIVQHYLQGQWISSVYKHLIPSNFLDLHRTIYVVSTDYNRTIMSAEAALAGMLKIINNLNSWHGLGSYVVPIHSIPKEKDALLQVTKTCARMSALLAENVHSERYQRVMKESKEVANILEHNLGVNITLIYNYQDIYRILSIEKMKGLELGSWAEAVFPQPLKELAKISYAVPTWTKQLKRLRGGPFIKEIIDNIQRKADDPGFRSVSIYSAHDTSIAAFLNSLNDLYQVENLGPPPFAAVVIVEHRQKGSRNHVRILYRCPLSVEDSPDCNATPRVLTIPGCEAVCPFEEMVNIVRDVLPVDWELECQL